MNNELVDKSFATHRVHQFRKLLIDESTTHRLGEPGQRIHPRFTIVDRIPILLRLLELLRLGPGHSYNRGGRRWIARLQCISHSRQTRQSFNHRQRDRRELR